jgi:hypothetical protein
MSRINRQGSKNGINLPAEDPVAIFLVLGGQILIIVNVDIVSLELTHELKVNRPLSFEVLINMFSDGLKLFGDGKAVHGPVGYARTQKVLQVPDPLHHELVEVCGEDN